MTEHRWVRDLRPVREVVRDEAAPEPDLESWPFTIPAVAQLLRHGLTLPAGVTFLVGENGSGKSTLVEAVATAYGLDPEARQPQHPALDPDDRVAAARVAEAGPRRRSPRYGFFLRGETMHGYFTHLDTVEGARDYHAMSHGESFLELIAAHERFLGLWCLDEPEAALSFSSVLALMGSLHDLARRGAQILCATHSPQLASIPGATIFEVGEWGLRQSAWEDLVLVQNWRSYLTDPGRYLRHVID